MLKSNKIKPFLWFEHQAEEAAKFYASIFRNSRIGRIARYPAGSPGRAGSVMTVEFTLEGQDFIALNGGSKFTFNEAISFSVECETQEDIDFYWEHLLAGGGKPVQCGWLKDRYGVSWQVNAAFLADVYAGGDAKRAERVMQAMLNMVKLDLRTLQEAAK